MAISANAVFEVRTTGSDTACSGGFVTGASGTDYSQQNSAQYSLTGLTSAGAGNIILSTSASADMVGNLIMITGGTNFTTGTVAVATFQITSVVVGVSITCSTNGAGTAVSTGVGAAGTAVIGGAWASPGVLSIVMPQGTLAWIKAGTYTISSSSSGVANGILNITNTFMFINGYQTTRGDSGTPPLLQNSGLTAVAIVKLPSGANIYNVNVDGASGTTVTGISLAGGVWAIKCGVVNCTNTAFFQNAGSPPSLYFCKASGCSTQPAFNLGGVAVSCEAFNNTVTGFSVAYAINCLAWNNTGASSDGFLSQLTCQNCTAYGNGRDGFRQSFGGAAGVVWSNCVAENNAGWGFNDLANRCSRINCAGFNNTLGNNTSLLLPFTFNFKTGSAEFFVTPGSGNFAPNNTSGGGALLRAASYMGLTPSGDATNYQDIGAIQHQDSGGSSVIYPIFD